MADQVVTFMAEKGNNYDETGQAIASYGRSIVFLPAGATPGQQVRVILQEIPGKADRRGRPLYEAMPADVEYTERWKDNGDGTASRVKIAIDWLFVKSEVEVIETRALATRESTAGSRDSCRVAWGPDLASSQAEILNFRIIQVEAERVENGSVVWAQIGGREEPEPPQAAPILRVKLKDCDWVKNQLQVKYDPQWSVRLVAWHQVTPRTVGAGSAGESSMSVTVPWGNMPSWWRQEQEARYPVCLCGRQRRDSQNPDGYAKCEQCRQEETCDRCGKQAKIAIVHGRMICDACKPYEEAEQLIIQLLTADHRAVIAAEATRLLAGQALVGEEGEVVLRATADHITSLGQRDQLLQKWAGYGWYYFCGDGVWGTKFSPAALQLFQHLPQATGNGLVELIGWIFGTPRPSGNDFYHLTQVEGKVASLPINEGELRQLAAKIDASRSVLADWLRGSEADRQATVAGLARLSQIEEQSSGELRSVLKEASSLMQAEAQNYQAVLAKVAETEQLAVGLERLQTLLQTEYSVCPACGQPWEVKDGTECGCIANDATIQPPFPIKRSCVVGRVLVSVDCEEYSYHVGRYSYPVVRLKVHDSKCPELSEVKTETLWAPPSEEERELLQRKRELEERLESFDRDLEQCEGDYPSRVLLKFELDAQRGTLFAFANVRELWVLDNKSQLNVQISGAVRFVCDPGRCKWLDSPPEVGESWVSSWGKMIGRDKKGRPIVIANPQVRIDSEVRQAIEKEIDRLAGKAVIAAEEPEQ